MYSKLSKLIEGSLEVKLPTIWTDEKQRWEESEKRREGKRREEKKKEDQRRNSEERRSRCAKKQESRGSLCFFQWFVALEGRKVGSLKRRVRSHVARWEMKSWTPLWHEAHLQVKKPKAPHVRSTVGSCDVESVHAVVAGSTFRSQNVQNTPGSDHFLKLRCSKKCTLLWCEAHFEVKSVKNWRSRATFGRSDVVSHGKRKGLCTLPKVSKTWRFCSSFNYNHHYSTLHSTTQHYNYDYNHIIFTLHYVTLGYVTLHYITLHYITLITWHCATLHYTKLHSITLRYTNSNYSCNCPTLHSTTRTTTTTTTTATTATTTT